MTTGGWALAPTCVMVHDPFLYLHQTSGGYTDDNNMHHHWEEKTIQGETPSEELEIKFPIFVANLVIVDAGNDEVLLDLKMSGRHRVVLDLLTLAGDTVKEDVER